MRVTTATAAPRPAFTFGPFAVDSQGRLSPRDSEAPPGFVFHWRDRLVHARLTGPAQGDGELALEATLGRVPSSALMAETPARRARSFALLRSLPPVLPPDWAMRLLPDHRIHLRVGTRLALPITAIGLVAALTGFLLTLAPYLDLLDEDGVAPGKVSAGNVNF